MRIERIRIKNLFRLFNHDISMNMQEHLTIIHGPNGYGKTILLKLLNGLFNSQYNILNTVPFSELSIYFDNNNILQVTKNIPDGKVKEVNKEKEILFRYKKSGKISEKFLSKPVRNQELNFPIGLIEDVIPELERIGPQIWIHTPTDEKLTLGEVLERFSDRLPIKFKIEKPPKWLKELTDLINVRIIETQRLLIFNLPPRISKFHRRQALTPAVITYSEELAEAIKSKLAEYATLAQSLDRTFPARLVKESPPEQLTIGEVRNKLKELEEKRTRLIATGLLEAEEGMDFSILQKINQENLNVLSFYVKDVEQKLSEFDEISNKIDVLLKIMGLRVIEWVNSYLFKHTSQDFQAKVFLIT